MAGYRNANDALVDGLAGLSCFLDPLPEPERTTMIEQTYEILKAGTGQDFGYDVTAWRAWTRENPNWDDAPGTTERIRKVVARHAKEELENEHTG